jgi:hypothetical protein
MKNEQQGLPVRKPANDRPMKKIVVRRTEPIKVTSAPLNHQPGF